METCKFCGGKMDKYNELIKIEDFMKSQGFKVKTGAGEGAGSVQFLINKNGKAVITYEPESPTLFYFKENLLPIILTRFQ